MARPPRYFFPDLASHVMVRGNDRQDMFATEGDRLMFLRFLKEACQEHSVAVHGYSLMPNHVHFMATGAFRDSLSRMVQDVARRYVPAVNQQWGRCGALWQSRFKAVPVDTDRYALNLLVYIDDNPVRAHIVDDAAAFPWSSHRCLAFGQGDDLITPHPVYHALGATPEERQARYRSRFAIRLCPEQLERIRSSIRRGEPLGDEAFLAALAARSGRRVLRRRTGRPPKRSPEAQRILDALFEEMDRRAKVGSDPSFGP